MLDAAGKRIQAGLKQLERVFLGDYVRGTSAQCDEENSGSSERCPTMYAAWTDPRSLGPCREGSFHCWIPLGVPPGVYNVSVTSALDASALTALEFGGALVQGGGWPLVHFSAQPVPLLGTSLTD